MDDHFLSELIFLSLRAASPRHGVLSEVADLIDTTKLPVFVTPMGKGSVDETNPQYGGVYVGSGSHPDVIKMVETSDCILWVGNYPVSPQHSVYRASK